jgi:hypothetical protein
MGYHDDGDSGADKHLLCLYRVVLREDIILEKDYIGKFKKGLVRKGSYDVKMAVGNYTANRKLMAFKKEAIKCNALVSCKIVNPALNM